MASLSYFWNEAMWQKAEPKRKYASRFLMHFLPIFMIELMIIIISFYYISYLPHILYWPLVTIISLLCFDMIHTIRNCMINDIHKSLKYDARWRLDSAKLLQDYEYYAEMYAYIYHDKYQNQSCSICLNQFGKEPPDFYPSNISILQCGHLYHHKCLENYQRYKWSHNNWPFPYSKCSLCKQGYHVFNEKFDYNPNYNNELAWYYKEWEYPGRRFIEKYFWVPLRTQYIASFYEDWNQYPQAWNINYFNDC